MQIIKLGGSLITDKKKVKRPRKGVMERLATEMAAAGEKLMVVHGAGSYGHYLAKEGKLNEGFIGDWQLEYLSKVHRDMRELNLMVINAMIDAGMNPISIPPSSIAIYEAGNLSHFPTQLFEMYSGMGLTPLSFGDMVPDTKRLFAICSGDHIMRQLSGIEGVERAIFATDVDGIYDRPPNEKGAKLLDEVYPSKEVLTELMYTDTTGGMAQKISDGFAISRKGVEVIVINGLVEGRLEKAIKGENVPGTIIRWSKDD